MIVEAAGHTVTTGLWMVNTFSVYIRTLKEILAKTLPESRNTTGLHSGGNYTDIQTSVWCLGYLQLLMTHTLNPHMWKYIIKYNKTADSS
jgi:hypothetical protein